MNFQPNRIIDTAIETAFYCCALKNIFKWYHFFNCLLPIRRKLFLLHGAFADSSPNQIPSILTMKLFHVCSFYILIPYFLSLAKYFYTVLQTNYYFQTKNRDPCVSIEFGSSQFYVTFRVKKNSRLSFSSSEKFKASRTFLSDYSFQNFLFLQYIADFLKFWKHFLAFKCIQPLFFASFLNFKALEAVFFFEPTSVLPPPMKTSSEPVWRFLNPQSSGGKTLTMEVIIKVYVMQVSIAGDSSFRFHHA